MMTTLIQYLENCASFSRSLGTYAIRRRWDDDEDCVEGCVMS